MLSTSCASLINRDYVVLSFDTKTPVKLIHENTNYTVDTIQSLKIKIKRDKKNIPIIIKNDSVCREHSIQWRFDGILYTEIVLLPYFLIDVTLGSFNKRIYTYRDSYLIDRQLNLRKLPLPTYKQGDLYFNLSFPLVNTFNLVPEKNSRQVNYGIGGLSFGMDYYYKQNHFLNFTFNN